MSQIAGLQDFRQEGPPADIGVFQFPVEVMVFKHVFAGTTYVCAIRGGERGWVLVSIQTDVGAGAFTVIQAALTAGNTFIQAASYTLSAKLTMVTANRTLDGAGKSTILRLANAVNDHMIHVTAAYCVIRNLQLDGNKANNSAALPGLFGIFFGDGGADGLVEGCYVHDCADLGITAFHANAPRTIIIGNKVQDNTRDGIAIDYTTGAVIAGNYCAGNLSSGIGVGLGATNVTITGNVCTGTTGVDAQGGIFVSSSTYDITIVGNVSFGNLEGIISYGYRVVIDGNQINSNVNNGIHILGGGDYAIISNNICYNQTNYDGIQLENGDYVVIEGNLCYLNRNGIILATATTNYNVISNNICVANTDDGIKLLQLADNHIIEGNVCTGNTGYGINIANANCDNNIIGRNQLGGNTAGCINDVGTGTKLPTLTLPFVTGTAAIVADGAPKGWRVAAAGEYALTFGVMSLDCQQVVRIKVWAVGLAAPAAGNQMLIDLAANGAQPDEVYTGEAIAVNSKESNETAFAVNDIVTWTFTPTNDADIGHLVAGDCLEIKMIYRVAVAPDIATNALLRCVEIQYV